MTREEFIKQRCEIDKITEEVFEKNYRVVECNCGQPYCKGYRCLDLDDLLKENQELKKQLSSKTLELEKNKTGYIRSLNNQLSENIEPDPEDFYLAEIEEKANDYDKLLIQQKEFIKHLTDEINKIKGQIKNYDIWHEVGTDINFLILKKQFYIEIVKKYIKK